MWLEKLKYYFIFIIFLFGVFLGLTVVYGANESITIDMSTPSGGGTCVGNNCNPTPVDNYPSISNITSSTSYTTALVSWTATDDNTVSTSSLMYGSTYGSYIYTGPISKNGDNYQVNISQLASGTIYYFRIRASDNAAQLTEVSGSAYRFETLPDSTVSIDNQPPVISNIQVSSTLNSAFITWQTDEQAYGQVSYFNQNFTTTTVSNNNSNTSHSIALSNLLPNTTYYYWLNVTDVSSNANSTSTSIFNFTTLKDALPPPNVIGPILSTTTGRIVVNWTNPSFILYPDFNGIKLVRKINTRSTDENDGTLLYTGSGQSYNDLNFNYNTNYFYTVFSFDTSHNTSTGAFNSIIYVSSTTSIPNKEINCSNNFDDDNDGSIDCADTDCASLSICTVCQSYETSCIDGLDNDCDGLIDCLDTIDCSSHASCQNLSSVEICTNGIDDDNDGSIDCLDSDCAGVSTCQSSNPIVTGVNLEICNNGIDDDNDGSIDCLDSDCAGFSGCVGTNNTIPACQDGLDNDSDGNIDYPADSGCENRDDTDEYNPVTSTVPSFIKLDLNDVNFFVGKTKIKAESVNSIIDGLSGSDLRISLPVNNLSSTPSSTVVKIGGQQYQMILDSQEQNYYTDIVFPSLSTKQAYLEINYGSKQFDSVSFKLQGLSFGDVYVDNQKRLSDVELTLYNKDGHKFNTSLYGTNNPIRTGLNGNYAWVVPNGQYYILASKDGFYDRKTTLFQVNNNIVNININLIEKPKKILDVIDTQASISANVKNVAINIGQKTKITAVRAVQGVKDIAQTTARVVNEVANNPQVEQAAEKVVAPASVGVVGVSILPFLSWSNLLPLLRLLFLQPLMLLGWRKRKKWGVVYNALSKMPVDLVIVRLLNVNTSRLVQSRVTDKQGRYAFIVNPGEYRLEVKKGNFVFPSSFLKNYHDDGRKVDIYHGEIIKVNDKKAIITANIPIDPVGSIKKPTRLIWQRFGRSMQQIISVVGIVLTAASLYISPKWFIALLLLIHICLYFIFRRLAGPRKIKSWGIVYDQETKRPVGRAIARLFNAKFNKLVSTQITDRKGRYQFLAADGDYYVTYEHKDYDLHKTEVNLKGEKEDVVDVDVSLRRKDQNPLTLRAVHKGTDDFDKEDEVLKRENFVKEESKFNKADKKLKNEKKINNQGLENKLG